MADSEALISDSMAYQFSDKAVRLGFIRRVYGILSAQLLVTAAIISAILYPEASKMYMKKHGDWVWGASLAGVVIFSFILTCCDGVRRKWPTNFICLFIFTVFESVFLGAVTSRYDTDAVLMAAGITAVITLGLTVFALQTRWDFTACGGIFLVLSFALLGFGIVCMFVRNHYANIAYASLGAVVFGLYLVFDTQMMLGGKHKYSLSPEEYVYAALNLYIDIINIFLFVLSIIQGSKD